MNVSPSAGPTPPISPVWAINELSKQLPLPTPGRRDVLEGPDAAVGPPLPYQPEVPVARRGECGQHHRAVRIQRSAQRNGPPGIVRPQLEPLFPVEAVDTDARHPVPNPGSAVQVCDHGQVLLDDTAVG